MIRTQSIYAKYEQSLDNLINQFLFENPSYKVVSIQHGGFFPMVDGGENETGEAALIVYEVEG